MKVDNNHEVEVLPEDLAEYGRELRELAVERRKHDHEAKKKQEHEAEVAAMNIFSKASVKISKGLNDNFEEKSGLGAEVKAKLGPFWIRLIGALRISCFIAILVGFTYSGYRSDQDQKYLSLSSDARDNGALASDFRTCLSVPNAITKVYTLDTNGKWHGDASYVPGKALYSFDLNFFEKSAATYKTFMLDVKARIAAVGAGAPFRNLAGNLAYLMTYQYKILDQPISTSTAVTSIVTLKGDPVYIFDKFYKSASLGAPTQQCKQSPDITFNRATGVFLAQYDWTGYYASDSGVGTGCCKPNSTPIDYADCILPPPDYGYKAAYDSSHFNIRYNINTLMSAFAVNQGINEYSLLDIVQTDLTRSSAGCYSLNSLCSSAVAGTVCAGSTAGLLYNSADSTCSIQVEGKRLYIEARMDGEFPGMDPIYCLVEAMGGSSAKQCFMRVGNTFVLPYFNHLGTSGLSSVDFYNYKTSCACTAPDFSTATKTMSYTLSTGGSATTSSTSVTMATSKDFSGFVGCKVTGTGIPAGGVLVSAGPTAGATITLASAITVAANTPLTFTCPMSSFYDTIYGTAGSTTYAYGKSEAYCSMFDLVHGFTLLKGEYYDVVLYNWMKSVIGVTSLFYTPAQINEMATVAAWTSLKFGGNAGAVGVTTSGMSQGTAEEDLLPNNGQLGINAYSWCSPTDASIKCAVYAMNTVDLFNQRIDAEGAIAAASSCANEFVIPDTAWVSSDGTAGAAIVPPTSLSQDYYECYNTEIKSVLVCTFS